MLEKKITNLASGIYILAHLCFPRDICAVSTEPDVGLELTHHEIMTGAKIKSWTLGAPGWLSRLSVRLQLRSRSPGP